MELYKNYPLKKNNTFGIESNAKLFAAPKTINEFKELIENKRYKNEKLFVLGGGSNVLFVNGFDGLIIHPQLFGKEITFEDESSVVVKVNAAEDWDSLVRWTVEKGLGGLENLSLIPGTVGACPVQNIGAYGVEVADLIEKVEALDVTSAKMREFNNKECRFAYRNSVFKRELKNSFIITSVYFNLSKYPVFKTHYGAVEEELRKIGGTSLGAIRQAVINIRESKLPDPKLIPNAGSFFKNPVVSEKQLTELLNKFPDIISYRTKNNQYKIAAGWMIDKLGWKGKQLGDAAVHDKQALVLINKQNASGKQIIELARQIQKSVFETFNVELEYEVNII